MFMYGMLYRTNHRFGPLLPLPAVNLRTFQAVLQILTKAYIVGEEPLSNSESQPKLVPTTEIPWDTLTHAACITRIVSVPLQQHELPWNALMEIREPRSGVQPEETSPLASNG